MKTLSVKEAEKAGMKLTDADRKDLARKAGDENAARLMLWKGKPVISYPWALKDIFCLKG